MGAFDAGARDHRVTIEVRQVTKDDTGLTSEVWTTAGRAWSNVRYGTGAERRAAAQEGTVQAATFGVLRNALTAGLNPTTHRLQFDGAAWDINAVVSAGANAGMVITATRGS